MVKNKKSLFSKFNEYKKQKKLQEYVSVNYPALKLPKIEWIKKECDIVNYDLIPSGLGWLVKFIGKIGSGKTTFVSAFVDFMIGYIKSEFKIYLLSPTIEQKGWNRIKK